MFGRCMTITIIIININIINVNIINNNIIKTMSIYIISNVNLSYLSIIFINHIIYIYTSIFIYIYVIPMYMYILYMIRFSFNIRQLHWNPTGDHNSRRIPVGFLSVPQLSVRADQSSTPEASGWRVGGPRPVAAVAASEFHEFLDSWCGFWDPQNIPSHQKGVHTP